MAVKKEINWELVELYLKSGSTQQKIADSLGIHKDTLADRIKEKYGINYSNFSSKMRSEGDLLIEAKQYDKAMKGYWPALLWLGKVRLGQREPDIIYRMAENQEQIDQSHRIMELEHEIAELKANANKPKTK